MRNHLLTRLAIVALILSSFILTGCGPARTEANNATSGNAGNGAPREQTSAQDTPTPSQPSNILFIIDSSGSMKTLVGGKTKMDTAKEVVTQLIGSLPAGTNAGLMAYGHRSKDDCKDVEILVPIGPIQPAFAEKVNALQPLGQTPISFSIRQAADVLRKIPGRKTVILVSDGEETCKEDPCAVAAELKKANVDLKVHVVGFGIDKAEAKKQLNCIAEATDGVYKDAADAAGLKQSLEGLAKAPDQLRGDRGRLVVESLDSHGAPIMWCVEVYPSGVKSVNEREFESCAEHHPDGFDVKPGGHDIYLYGAEVRSVLGVQRVEITEGAVTKLAVPQTGRLLVNITDESGSPVKFVAQLHSQTPGTTGKGTFYSSEANEVFPGTYEIEFWGGPARVDRRTVVIKSGEETKVDISIGP